MGYAAPDGTEPSAYWLGPPPTDRVSGFEWSGEWTVTYETFRDMGAAFAVALVLIYILVVWEFGNFRIPLVIMAPIPLTLLGIIPAHWLMFQLGLGGEFTATSMIGWIALAGIIVRNSILLVDFSIHEVQKGVPVAEAVIRACKTRTRPIVITALALVAGSSVIFTDPIFQGMAISLSSGVLVSTVLTLIVIPLGCVAASRDLCEVAVASAPAGTTVPCAEELLDERSTRDTVPPEPRGQRGPSPVLAKLGGALMMVFYLVRGIFLLLFDWVQTRFRGRRDKPGPGPDRGPDGAGDDSVRAGSGESGGIAYDQRSQSAEVRNALLAGGPGGEGAEQGAAVADDAVAQGVSDAPAGEVDGETPEPPKRTTKKKATAGRPAAAAPKVAKVQKKAARRGIRLKTEDDDAERFE
jgi:hypothetical protein